MASFRGKFFDGCYSGHDVKGRDYIQESINNIEIQRANIINHHDVIQFTTSDYKDFAIPNNSIIYCDPPYLDTTKYNKQSIDYDEFYDWCRQQTQDGNDVLISEYTAPIDFVDVFRCSLTNTMGTTNTYKPIEKLFVHESIADKYIEKTLFD